MKLIWLHNSMSVDRGKVALPLLRTVNMIKQTKVEVCNKREKATKMNNNYC